MIKFPIRGQTIELYKLIKAAGITATGGEAKWLISQGRVQVNNAVETRKAKKLKPGDRVELEGQTLSIEPFRKPASQ